ncbi:MAG: hypothetical protein ATN35_08655 [Epulopiscium sp. Nele67-Bin004]|nr:MAG: hypothetical protein ATN35_08655 [Epulopiscium sp. Nele67-Bin004]
MQNYMEILIWTMLFVVVVEMIFPSSHLQKYIKLILGFIVIYTILGPIIKGGLFEQGAYDEYVMYYQNQFNLATDKSIHLEEYEQELIEAFTEQETTKIINAIEGSLDVNVDDVTVVAYIEGYVPTTYEIWLELSYKEETGKIFIPQIKIGEKSDSIKLDLENLEKEVKNCLSHFYNWDKVHIIIQDVQ